MVAHLFHAAEVEHDAGDVVSTGDVPNKPIPKPPTLSQPGTHLKPTPKPADAEDVEARVFRARQAVPGGECQGYT